MLTKQQFLDKIREAGVVGAGGAGFPTHIKLNTKVNFFIVNVAECEPLLKVDQQLAEIYALKILQTTSIIQNFLGATSSFIAIKKKYKNAVETFSSFIKEFSSIKIKFLEDVYPAGDEQDIIYNLTGKNVPAGGIPIDVGTVVNNVGTVINISYALEGLPTIDRYLTISGAVKNPVTLKLPVGTIIKDIIQIAGGSTTENYVVIEGGPVMGTVVDENEPIKKTTTGIILLPKEHSFIKRKIESLQEILLHSRSVCEQCSICTEYCPRYLLGHSDLKPHKMMRKLNYINIYDLKSYTESYLCCECGICSYFACPMLLSPKDIYKFLKQNLIKNRVKNPFVNQKKISHTNPIYKYRRVPAETLLIKLNLVQYDHPALLQEIQHNIKKVKIYLKQHIGEPAEPIVYPGKKVKRGELIAKIPDNKIGANIHASISGEVTEITDKYIEISAI